MGEIETSLQGWLNHIYQEVVDNLEYITEIEGIEIPEVWQRKILQPIDFAIQQAELGDITLTAQTK